MISHELEALRRLLFFSVPEAAVLIGGVAEQTWRRWEAGSRAVPDDVAQRVNDLVGWRDLAIGKVTDLINRSGGAGAALVWYSSMDDWASLPGREPVLFRPHQSACATLLAARDGRPHCCSLVVFNGPVYAAWLGGREDSETARSAWAATQ